MSKITLEITEVVNGVSITETPITLVGDTLSAAASTTATGVTFTPAGGIAATNVQAALAELDTEKMNASNGVATDFFTMQGTNGGSIRWQGSANLLKVHDGSIIGFGASTGLQDTDFEIFHVSNNSYIRDTGAGTLFIQTDGPSITLGGTNNNNIVSGKFIPGAEATLYHNSSAKITTTANGIDVTGLVEFDSLSGTGAVAITDILDADDMSGASATTLSTSESIKAYVDAQVQSKDNSDEITEGSTNLYFTNARADARIAAADTGDLSEGSNLYFTNARADARIAAADTGDLSEGSNLYYTDARADARIAANLIDEDGFGTNSATRAPSQQSVKAYIAAQTANIQGDITKVTAFNGITGGGTTGDVGIAIDTSIVVTKTGTATMTNKILTAPDINTPDIDGGTIDGTVIGGATPAAGSFTSLQATGQVMVSGTTPIVIWNDTDGNERSSIFHAAGVAYYTCIDSDETFGAHRFRRDTQSGAPISIFETFANGDVKFYEDDGTSSILKTDAVNGRVGIKTSAPAHELDVTGKIQATELINTPIGATTPSTGKFTSLTVLDDTPTLLLNDSDGNEQFKISHQGGNSYINSFGSGTDFGAVTILRDNATAGIDQKAVLKCATNGDVRIFQDDGTTDLLKTDADQNRVGINNGSPQEALDVVGTAKATQLNIRTGTSLDSVATIKDNAEITSWTETGQSLFVGQDSGVGVQLSAHGLYVKPDGMRMYLAGSASDDDIEQFSIASASDAFDISKMVADNVRVGSLQESNPHDVYFADDPTSASTYGKKMYVIGTSNDRIRQYTISTAWDLSSTVAAAGDFNVPGGTNTTGIAFGRKATVNGVVAALGTRVYVVDSTQNNIKQFDLATAWDISSVDVSTRVDLAIDVDAIFEVVQSCTGIRFNGDGTEMYLTDNGAGDDVTQFGLSTPYDISSTITNQGALYTGEEDISIGGLHLIGTNIYTIDPGSDTIRQYTSDNTGISINSSSVFIPGDLRVRDQITALGLIRIDGQLRATGGSQFAGTTISGSLNCNSNTGLIRLGGTSNTAEIEVGRSTKTHTVSIHNAATESGETATVNIGTSGASGSTTNINIGGGVGTCTTTIDADLVIPGETPASATAAGTQGQIAWDDSYIYICTATNTWKRAAIGTW